MIENIIIIDNNSYPKGGTAQVAVSSAIELAHRGYQITYIAADGNDGKMLFDAGICVINLNQYELKENPNRIKAAINGIWNKNVLREVQKILAEFKKESTIIHIHGYMHRFSPSILKACSESGIKTVLTLHDYFILCPCGGFYDYSKRTTCKISPMSLKCVLCNCDKRNYFQKIWRVIRQLYANKYGRYNQKLNLIYISDFSFSKMRNELVPIHNAYYVRNPYDLGDNILFEAEKNRTYVYLGRLSSEKGVDIFCKAFSQLKGKGLINGQAIVVGDGDQREKLSKEYVDIAFLGWKNHEEIVEIIQSARALVFPSKWYEGAPLTPIEFMSHGIPCISSDACSAVEYIEDNVNGLVFKSEDVQDLKDKLCFADDDMNWKRISQNLRDSFNRDEYSVKSHVTRLLDVYDLILNAE